MKWTPYTIKFEHGVPVGAIVLYEKHGYIMQDKGALAELSVLPELHGCRLEEAKRAIQKNSALPAPARFCVESCELAHRGELEGLPDVKLNVLVPLGARIPKDTHTAKIKIGHNSPEAEIPLLLNQLKGFSGKVRLDGNRRLGPEELHAYWSALGEKIEYFEEPLRQLPAAAIGIPMALDESVTADLANLTEDVVALVVKPTLFGLKESLALITKAKQQNIKTVISTTYETDVGLKALRWLAVQAGTGHAHGIASYGVLVES